MADYLFNTEKIEYVKGKKPDVECILCAIRDGHPDVKSLLISKSDKFLVTLNLYPFNPGQLMIFPVSHVETIDELADLLLALTNLDISGYRKTVISDL